MRNRYSIGKISVGKSNTSTEKDTNLTLSEILAFCSMATLFLAVYIPHELISTILTVVTVTLFFVAAILNFIQQSAIIRWRQSLFMTFVAAIGWSGYSLFRYFAEKNVIMLYIAAGSVIMWALFIFCLYRWNNIRDLAQTPKGKRKGSTIFYGWGNKGRKLFIPDIENGKLDWADFTLCLAIGLLIDNERLSIIPDFPFKQEVIYTSVILLVLFSYYRYYHSLCPMSRWHRSTWATGMTAIAWCAVPLICYATGAWSGVMWIVFAFCRYKLWQTRRRVRAEVAMIEWRIRNKR